MHLSENKKGDPVRLPVKVILLLLFSFLQCYGGNRLMAQSKKLVFEEKNFQLSFFPGISTNGLYSADFYNYFSVNLTSGLSAGNHYFELGVISNLNIRSTSGIQIAGFANIVGSNSFINLTRYEEQQLRESGVTAELKGFQFSGLINYVREDITGAQFSGGFNINQLDAYGFQAAGLSNLSGRNVTGVQLSGLVNMASKSMTGFQISAAHNFTKGSLIGSQLSAFNRAGFILGRHSKIPTAETGLQIGIVNKVSKMDGLQIGLINISKKTRGTQIGLINIFRPGPYPEGVNTKYGTPIGLINIGSSGSHLRVYATDVFLFNVEYTTGNCHNCSFTQSQMPLDGRFKVLNQNALIYGRNVDSRFNDQIKWGIGYGFEKVLLNKASMSAYDARNHRLQLSYGLRFIHLNKSDKLDRELSLLTRFHAEVGVRFLDIYWFAGAGFNMYLFKGDALNIPSEISSGSGIVGHQLWPGYSFGIQF